MVEIDRRKLVNWSPNKPGEPLRPLKVDIICPNRECSRSQIGQTIKWSSLIGRKLAFAKLACGFCETDIYLILFDENPKDGSDQNLIRVFMDPSPAPDIQLPKDVNWRAISPRFVEVYEQAVIIDELGFFELVGMGYRKALEVLIKDYLSAKFPDVSEQIKSEYLSSSIQRINDERIKETARRATWLMNDETHYIRLHSDRDLSDLKELMRQFLHWIAIEIKNTDYLQSMTEKKK